MQKYLHSRYRKIKRNVVLTAILTATVFFTFVLMKKMNNDSIEASIIGTTKYMSISENTKNSNETKDNKTNESEFVDKDKKMNNSALENSKTQEIHRAAVTKTEFDGVVKVLMRDGLIKNMSIEDYVYGCLLGEMPLNFHTQALMAQSVAIRSFTVNKILVASKHKNANVCTNPACCQNYIEASESGYSKEMLQNALECVYATKGIVAVWEGSPINAVYHASSGNNTKDSKEVWGGDVAYLKSVDSPYGEKEIFDFYYNGKGGHGVGMSQQGANLLAKEGKGYAQILCYYYSGIYLDYLNY